MLDRAQRAKRADILHLPDLASRYTTDAVALAVSAGAARVSAISITADIQHLGDTDALFADLLS